MFFGRAVKAIFSPGVRSPCSRRIWYQMVNEIDDELVEMIPAEMAFPIGIDAGCLNLEGFISYLIHSSYRS